MQKQKFNLDIKQKYKAGLVLFLMYIIMSAMFLLNSEIKFTENIQKGILLLILLLLVTFSLYFYLVAFAKKYIAEIKCTVMIAVLFLICLQLNMLFKGNTIIYSRPLFTFAMLATILIGKQKGIILNFFFLTALFLYDIYANSFSFENIVTIYSIVAGSCGGILAVISISQNSRRFDSVMSAFKLGIVSMLAGVLVYSIFFTIDIAIVFVGIFSYLSSLFSLLLYLGLLPIFERLFNIITTYRLNELTDHNRTLLKQLSIIAPGTFNHSLILSNLAEACAIAIGENPQIARAAAYYHDIGKIKNPQYFKENQYDKNPHDDLTPELSANFIKKHATDGYNLCKEYNLPDEIANICLEHHGTTIIKYFYIQAKKYTEGGLSIKQFCYDGPKPTSKIAAIIMIADACEAAIRVLKNREKETIEKQVKEIVNERMEFEQFSDCDITIKDIYIIMQQIVKISAGIYHDRTYYPKLKFTKEDKKETEKDNLEQENQENKENKE